MAFGSFRNQIITDTIGTGIEVSSFRLRDKTILVARFRNVRRAAHFILKDKKDSYRRVRSGVKVSVWKRRLQSQMALIVLLLLLVISVASITGSATIKYIFFNSHDFLHG